MKDTTNYKEYKIVIDYDNVSESPREWDNLGTIAYKHRKYTLGEEVISDPIDWLSEKLDLTEKQVCSIADKLNFLYYSNGVKEELEYRFFNSYIALPVYLYDHSGITINTTGFSCRWDSGQLGYIYISKEIIRREYNIKRISAKLKKQIYKRLKSEIGTYDQFLKGEIYFYEIFDNKNELLDSCCGFYGIDYCMAEAKSIVDYEIMQQPVTNFLNCNFI